MKYKISINLKIFKITKVYKAEEVSRHVSKEDIEVTNRT